MYQPLRVVLLGIGLMFATSCAYAQKGGKTSPTPVTPVLVDATGKVIGAVSVSFSTTASAEEVAVVAQVGGQTVSFEVKLKRNTNPDLPGFANPPTFSPYSRAAIYFDAAGCTGQSYLLAVNPYVPPAGVYFATSKVNGTNYGYVGSPTASSTSQVALMSHLNASFDGESTCENGTDFGSGFVPATKVNLDALWTSPYRIQIQ